VTKFEPEAFEGLLQILRSAYPMVAEGMISQEDYDKLKSDLFSAVARSFSEPESPTASAARDLARGEAAAVKTANNMALHAGDLHRMIVQQMVDNVIPAEGAADHMERMAKRLAEQRTLHAEDMPHMMRLIEVVCDDAYSQTNDTMMDGVAKINAVNDEVRGSSGTSPTAKVISGIANDSAQNAALGRITTVASRSDKQAVGNAAAAPATAPSRGRLWKTVKEDVGGALEGASLVTSLLALYGVPASSAFVNALGTAVAVAPAVGAVIAGGVKSGLEYLNRKPE